MPEASVKAPHLIGGHGNVGRIGREDFWKRHQGEGRYSGCGSSILGTHSEGTRGQVQFIMMQAQEQSSDHYHYHHDYHYHYQLLPITTSYHLFPLSHARLQQIQSSVSLSLITHRRKSCGSLFGKTQAGRVEDVAELVAAALTAPSCVNTEIAAGEPCANKARSERWGSRGQLTERSEGRFEKLSTCRQMHYTTVIRCTSCTSLQVHGAYRSGM